MVPDVQIEEHGRIGELTLGRTALVTVAVALALALLTVRGQDVEGGHLPGRCHSASTSTLSFLGRPISILGSIPVSLRLLSP